MIFNELYSHTHKKKYSSNLKDSKFKTYWHPVLSHLVSLDMGREQQGRQITLGWGYFPTLGSPFMKHNYLEQLEFPSSETDDAVP